MPGRHRLAAYSVPLCLTVAIAFADVVGTPRFGRDRFEPGSLVRYSEDLTGRDWTVVGQREFGRYTIRCKIGPYGPLECIAEAHQIAPAPVELTAAPP